MVSMMAHLNESQGQQMLDTINLRFPSLLASFEKFRENDLVGNPLMYEYPRVGFFSPANLRYIKIAGEIDYYFGNLEGKTIIEIGGGYGGQCKILSDLFDFKEYILVDLPEVLALAKRYLDHFGIKNVRYLTMDELPEDASYDLVISNYAFSEFVLYVQEVYFNRVLAHSANGFLLCNQIYGMSDIAHIGPGEMTFALKKLRRKPKIFPEIPRTARDNYLLVWKES